MNEKEEKIVEIFFLDLSSEKQNDLLKLYEVKDPKEMNWDVFPISRIVRENK